MALDGNLSTRLSSELFLATRAGCHKGLLRDDDLVVVDAAGRHVRGAGRPTSELAMHLACYSARPDVEAVIHTHPPTGVALPVAGVSLARCVLPEVVLTLGSIPTLSYETTGSGALAEQVSAAMADHDAVILDHHGAVCAGGDLLEAFCRLETLEHSAHVLKLARDLGGVQDLPADEAIKLRSAGLKRFGGPPSAQARAEAPGADLPESCTTCSGCGHARPDGLGEPAGFSVARLTDRPLQVQDAGRLEAEIRRAISEVLDVR